MNKHPNRPYKLIIWGPGGLGSIAIWEALTLPGFDVVGVRCYSDGSVGVDAGEFVGLPPIGVKLSNKVEELLALDADCVIYTARDIGLYHTDEEIFAILESGKHVITPLPYQQAHLIRDQAFQDRLDQACKKGGTVFHATGVNPDTVSERVLQSLSGMCTDISQITVQEIWECSNNSPELMAVVGIGKSPQEAEANPMSAAACANILKAVMQSAAQAFIGKPFARIEAISDYVAAPEDVQSRYMHIRKGQVGRVAHRMEGFVEADDAQPFFTMQYHWLIGDCMFPPGVRPGQYYAIDIEGRPSIKVALDVKASLKSDERLCDLGKLKTEPGYHSVVAACLQTLPLVCAAAPGLLPSFKVPVHWQRPKV